MVMFTMPYLVNTVYGRLQTGLGVYTTTWDVCWEMLGLIIGWREAIQMMKEF